MRVSSGPPVVLSVYISVGWLGHRESIEGTDYRLLSSIPGLYPLMPVAPFPKM